MKTTVKDIDGQRSMTIEVTDELPGSLFAYTSNGACWEFDRAIVLRAFARMQESETA
jgi:hypothetical protein